MPLARESKANTIERFRVHPKDTGSPEVQIALLSERISYLNEHFRAHRKDHASRRGLLNMVGRRKRHLEYLKRRDPEAYKAGHRKVGHPQVARCIQSFKIFEQDKMYCRSDPPVYRRGSLLLLGWLQTRAWSSPPFNIHLDSQLPK